MKKIILAVITAALLFTLGSCSEDMFLGNIFTDMEPYEEVKLPNLEGVDTSDLSEGSAYYELVDGLADDLSDDIASGSLDDRFLQDVAALGESEGSEDDDGTGVNDGDVRLILDALKNAKTDVAEEITATGGSLIGNDDYQDLALMEADVAMEASGATEIFANFNEVIGDAVSESDSTDGETSGDSTFDSVESIVDALFTSDAATVDEQKADISDMLTGLLAVNDALSDYGTTIDPDDTEDQTPTDENAGDLAAQALLAGVTTVLVNEVIDTSNPDMDTTEEAVAAITAALFEDDVETALGNLIPAESTALDIPEDGSITDILDPGIAAVVMEGIDLSAFGI